MALNWLLSFANAILPKQAGDGGGGRNKAEEVAAESGFQMPLHYPRYTRSDYEKMEEAQVDLLLLQYGLKTRGSLEEKRKFAMGAFLWPDQY